MRVLNLYAGVGGNRKLWGGCDVTAVELEPEIAKIYHREHPNDELIIGDAHQYLLEHYSKFDFIWTSPPCQTHSRMAVATRHALKRFPDLSLYQEILFLQTYSKASWVVENVVPYYSPLISPTKQVGRHLFWANFPIDVEDVERPAGFINKCNVAGKRAMQEWLGIHYPENIYYGDNHCPAQILRNCVHPKLGLQIFHCALMNDPAFQ